MKIFELAEKLKEIYDMHGNIEVFFAGPNRDTNPYEVGKVEFRVAVEDEYPEDFDMPEGYEFVELGN